MASLTYTFIPTTTARSIGDGVFFRPIKSWHSATFAGEKLYKIPGADDGSGCLLKGKEQYRYVCSAPLTVTHRLYWHDKNKEKTISAFLSYPDGMGAMKEYFWETYGISCDIERFTGDNAEEEMEKMILKFFKETL